MKIEEYRERQEAVFKQLAFLADKVSKAGVALNVRDLAKGLEELTNIQSNAMGEFDAIIEGMMDKPGPGAVVLGEPANAMPLAEVWLKAWRSSVIVSTAGDATLMADRCLEDYKKRFVDMEGKDA